MGIETIYYDPVSAVKMSSPPPYLPLLLNAGRLDVIRFKVNWDFLHHSAAEGRMTRDAKGAERHLFNRLFRGVNMLFSDTKGAERQMTSSK